MEKILHQILINIYDWRMWVVLICIPLLFAGVFIVAYRKDMIGDEKRLY